MKIFKKLGVLTLATVLVSSIVSVANPNLVSGVSLVNYRMIINGEQITIPRNYQMMSKNNTTYVPLRFVSENLGSIVKYEKGTVTIEDGRYMRDLENGTIKPIEANRRKLDEALKEIESLKKENESLKTQIASLEKKYESSRAYRKLPTGETDTFGFSLRLDSITSSKGKATLNVVLDNKDKDNMFYFLPEKTELVLGTTASNSPVSSTPVLSSTLMPYTTAVGLSSIAGEINFDIPYEKDVNGMVTFYYRVNGSSEIKNMTLYFDTKK